MNDLQKQKKGIFGFLKIAVIFSSLICLTSCWQSSNKNYGRIIPSDSIATYTKDELIDLYWEYKDELNEVAKIAMANASLRKEMIDNNLTDKNICEISNKKHFSEDDWEKIVALCEKIRPSAIELKNGGPIGIYGKRFKTDDGWVSVSLQYFHNSAISAKYPKKGMEQLDGYWYIKERISEW